MRYVRFARLGLQKDTWNYTETTLRDGRGCALLASCWRRMWASCWRRIQASFIRFLMVMSQKHRSFNRRRWAYVRWRVLERDGWRCVKCGKAGRLEVDHTIPLHHGGAPYSMSNLQALCRGCHIAKTRQENAAAASTPPHIQKWRDMVESRMC